MIKKRYRVLFADDEYWTREYDSVGGIFFGISGAGSRWGRCVGNG